MSRAQAAPSSQDLQAVGDAPVPTPAPGALEAQTLNVQTVFQLTNEDRARQGLGPLQWSAELGTAARAHAARMAAASREGLSHRYPGEDDLAPRASRAGAHFASIAENIAQGSSATAIEKQWMNSVPHRTNILDPRMNAIGIAVFASGGTLYAVEDFAAAVASLTGEAVEQQVVAELRSLPVDTAAGAAAGEAVAALTMPAELREEARRGCSRSGGEPGEGSKARFILSWQGSDLALPAPLVAAVRTGQYRAAAVGACSASGGNAAFTTYRVTVLLY